MPWLSLSVALEAASAEALGDALLEQGAQSVWIDPPESSSCRLSALLPQDADAGAIVAGAAAACGLPAPRFSVGRVEDEDWVRRTQEQFAPIVVSDRLWVGPGWHEPAPGWSGAVVRIDPGMAFGTGSHPTTRLMLEYLASRIPAGARVLDYGCGSGILAIAAARLGAAAVDAVDLDPLAVETTAANAARNAVALRAMGPEGLPPGDYDVVVANILAQPLIVLAPLLAARVAPGGRIALSGILEAQADEVAAAYAPWLRAAPAAVLDGWARVEGARA